MKKLLVFCFLITSILNSYSQNSYQNVLNNMVMMNDCDSAFLFKTVGESVKDKRIIILGEAGHGDGATFKLKSDLIKYLNKNYGFNTVILEGGGFFDYQYLNGNLAADSIIPKEYLGWRDFWSSAKETQSLVQLNNEGNIKFVGMDSDPSYGYYLFPYYLKNQFVLNEIDWDLLGQTSLRLMKKDTNLTSGEIKEIENIYWDISQQIKNSDIEKETKDILIQTILNCITQCKSFRNFYIEKDPRHLGINFRDAQMAQNVRWYLDKYPNEKVVIWTANFHASVNIGHIVYNSDDSTLYDYYNVLGMILKRSYWDEVHSIAFTAGGGETGLYLSEKSFPVKKTTNTLEGYLFDLNVCLGYLDCSSDNINRLKSFRSTILGYRIKQGLWYKAFDGIIYLKTQFPSTRY